MQFYTIYTFYYGRNYLKSVIPITPNLVFEGVYNPCVYISKIKGYDE